MPKSTEETNEANPQQGENQGHNTVNFWQNRLKKVRVDRFLNVYKNSATNTKKWQSAKKDTLGRESSKKQSLDKIGQKLQEEIRFK